MFPRAMILTITTVVLVCAFSVGDSVSVAQENPAVDIRRGLASWYSQTDPGIQLRTANNEIFNDQAYTCAMWGVPFNQKLKVTNLDNGKSVVCRVNDRGPHKRFVRQGRIVDLSKKAFGKIADHDHGLINIELEFL